MQHRKDVTIVGDIRRVFIRLERDVLEGSAFRFTIYQFQDSQVLVSEDEGKKASLRLVDLASSLANMAAIKERVKRDLLAGDREEIEEVEK